MTRRRLFVHALTLIPFLIGMVSSTFATTSKLQARDVEFAVVVNKSNRFKGSPQEIRTLLKRLFTKKEKFWSNTKCRPYDRAASSVAHKAFVSQILRMSESDLSDHWKLYKQLRGETRPRVVATDRRLLKFVSRYKGAFGVIESSQLDAKLAKGTRVLLRFSFKID